MVKLSIIIVNYKNQNLIQQCVKSIVEYEKEFEYEIIVVDNNSKDDTEKLLRKIYPHIIWIQMGYNSGYGRANNRGIEKSNGENILLLNSDIIINKPNIINASFNFFINLPSYTYTILGIRLVNPDGSYQPTLRLKHYGIIEEIKKNSFYIFLFDKKSIKKTTEQENQKEFHYRSGFVKWINGAFLMMNKDIIIRNNLFFDEDFFLYGEDNEWCRRATKRGLNFYHWHEPELIHLGSASTPNNITRRAQITVSQWLFILKTRNVLYYLSLLLIVFSNLCIDGILLWQQRLKKQEIEDYIFNESKFRKLSWYLLFKYGLGILFNKKLSNKTSFYTNCYEDKRIQD